MPVHLHHFSSKALQQLLRDTGFAIADERTRGGDTLFLLLSGLQSIGVSVGEGGGKQPHGLTRAALRVLGEVTRPYYALGDDELAVIARA